MKRHPVEQIVSRQWWIISVGGYGSFAYYGSDEEAEEMRSHKARWEGGAGRKRLALEGDALVQRRREAVRREVANGYQKKDEREIAEATDALAG